MSLKSEAKQRLRAALVARDGNECAFCGLEGDETNPSGSAYLTIDRIVPATKGGKYVVGNCRLLCARCAAERPDDERTVQYANPASAKGYTIIPNVVLLDRELSIYARGLYAMLVHYARQDEACFPGQARLSGDLGISERKLRDATRELEGKRLIRAYRRGRGDSNLYVILDAQRPRQDRQEMPLSAPDRQDVPVRPAGDAAQDRHLVPPTEYADNEGHKEGSPPTVLAPDSVPEGFPDDLRSVLTEVHAILHRAAAARKAPAPPVVSIARAMVLRAEKRSLFVATAEKIEHWAVYGRGKKYPFRDAVARWRAWLDEEEAPAAAASGNGLTHAASFDRFAGRAER